MAGTGGHLAAHRAANLAGSRGRSAADRARSAAGRITRRRRIRFHAAQSVAAFGVVAAAIAAFAGLALMSLSFLPSAFMLFLWAAGATWVAGVALWLVVMWKAATGRVSRIPIAAELADRLLLRP